MIERYSLPEMAGLWTDEYKFSTWLEVEIAACEGWAALGKIPTAAVKRIRSRAKFDTKRILKIEDKVKHDVIAFLTNVGESVGADAQYIHYGLTSSDVLDTATAVVLKRSGELLVVRIKQLLSEIRKKARRYKYQPKVGRTHGVHAEPTSLGLTFAVWYAEMARDLDRLKRAIDNIAVGKLSGAVGTFANTDPKLEKYVCRKLKLKPAPVSTQIIQRDRHAEFIWALAVTASSLDKFATEIRHLQKTEVLEIEEGFSKGQKGSSAMPHKKNPITCERVSGLARLLRGNMVVALENIPLWHERDISHSSVERVIFPDSTIILDYMLYKFTEIVKNLNVYPKNLMANLEKTGGLIYAGKLLLSVTERLGSREEAYQVIQEAAHAAWESGTSFKDELLAEPSIRKNFTSRELEKMFDYKPYLKHVDTIFARVFK
ncbi:MAG: adenylosuccinate lyase [candidate division Zixibacteria bacterium]|nr:adenylosuccinate lyase [candidate division Zixibacteria bacterium]MBU1471733.1 adenylosuccinate lyase [candidate division Zixibacteria bacterium]MBU2625169.1 adenylosuccinate lyase [candidate division Zixibacteria bacterium]